jgi:hypothetical protein
MGFRIVPRAGFREGSWNLPDFTLAVIRSALGRWQVRLHPAQERLGGRRQTWTARQLRLITEQARHFSQRLLLA